MSRRVNFTKAVIEAVKSPPEGQRLVLIDTKTAGLQCRITHTGVKTFSVFRRVKGGQPERITLGKFDDMSVEQARTTAAQINASIASGGSPAQVKRAHKAETTFKELFTEYIDRYAKHKKRTWKEDEGRYPMYLEKPLGHKRLSQITRADIASIHTGITKQVKKTKKIVPVDKQKYKGGATANRVLALISSVFNWGMTVGLCEVNPAKGIKKNPERSRDRFLQKDELPKFFQSLTIETNLAIRDYVLLSLLTGARQENVISMRWDEISFDRNEWRIPRTKNNESQTIPLGEEIMLVLNERKDNGSDFVFPGKGETGHLVEPRKGWERILKRAGIKDLRIHDLRRTMGSWQAKTGASLVIIGKSLGHKSQVATQVYSRLDLDPVRKSVETATSAILEAAGVKKTAKVKQFKKKRKKKAL